MEAAAAAGEDLGVADVEGDGSGLSLKPSLLNFHRPKLMGFVDLLMRNLALGHFADRHGTMIDWLSSRATLKNELSLSVGLNTRLELVSVPTDYTQEEKN